MTNEDVSHEELGGYRVHALKSGVAGRRWHVATTLRRADPGAPAGGLPAALQPRKAAGCAESYDDVDRREASLRTPCVPANANW